MVKQRVKLKPLSSLEEELAIQLRALKLPPPEREYKFLAHRKFRFDFAWPDHKLAVEVDGGTWSGGRHTRGAGYEQDCFKMALAVQDGWRIYRFTGKQVKDGTAIGFIIAEFFGDKR